MDALYMERYRNHPDEKLNNLYRRWMWGDKPLWMLADLSIEMDKDFMKVIDAWEAVVQET